MLKETKKNLKTKKAQNKLLKLSNRYNCKIKKTVQTGNGKIQKIINTLGQGQGQARIFSNETIHTGQETPIKEVGQRQT